MKNKNILLKIFLFASVLIFFFFGSFQLTKFETSDEYLWKHTRIPQYWSAIQERDWEETYINDKPGVTVALFSGLGLLFEPEPENHHIKDRTITQNNFYTVYATERTEAINASQRYPVLIFNTLFLLVIFWLIKKATDNSWLALLTAFFIASSPILIGISQIANPDSFLWSFSAAAIFSYFALLKTGQKRFVVLTGLFTGMSLLSKYTANILFPIYLLILFSTYFFDYKNLGSGVGGKRFFLQGITNFFLIFLTSLVVFSIFMPAVFVKPIYLYEGTIGFSGLKMLLGPILAVLGAVSLDAWLLQSKLTNLVGSFFFRHRQKALWLVAVFILSTFLVIIANSWLDQKAVPYESIKDEIYAKGKGGFGKITKEFSFPKKLLVEFYPLVHSLNFFFVFILLFYWTRIALGKKIGFPLHSFLIMIIPILYFSAAMLSKVLTNIRYSIMLYPLFYLLVAIASLEIIKQIKNRVLKAAFIAALVILPLLSLWNSKPHYFSYTNILLPQKYSITDSWGYGSYEAAQYLNSLPEAQDLTVWTNRKGLCQFFVGKCTSKENLDLSIDKPDYFVISQRGSLKNRFDWKDPSLAKNSSDYYYDKLERDYEWVLFVNDRPTNYVKIIRSEE